MTMGYIPESYIGGSALSSHDDLQRVIRILKENPDLSRQEITAKAFSGTALTTASPPLLRDRSRAINMAASLILLLN